MPFVTEYNTTLVFKKLIGEIPENIKNWEPYKKSIFFLNRLDKTNILYFKMFCENPVASIDGKIYNPIDVVDLKQFVYEGSKPSYHKFDSCEKLGSNFVNFRIPEIIKEKGDDAVQEYRKWFKEHQEIYADQPDVFQMRLQLKYGIQSVEKVDYKNSGNVYKENLTLKEIEVRIDSLLHNASAYYNENPERQIVIKRFQTATFLAFSDKVINENTTKFSDDELKTILKEYFYLFIQPTIFYLKEYFKRMYNSNLEIDEKIFEQLNFKKCTVCYSHDYEHKSNYLIERKQKLVCKFGDFEFPIEPATFLFKNIENTDKRIAFIYCRVYRCLDNEFSTDTLGNYKNFKVEFVTYQNHFFYVDSKIYEEDINDIILFKRYLTRIENDIKTNYSKFTTFSHEI